MLLKPCIHFYSHVYGFIWGGETSKRQCSSHKKRSPGKFPTVYIPGFAFSEFSPMATTLGYFILLYFLRSLLYAMLIQHTTRNSRHRDTTMTAHITHSSQDGTPASNEDNNCTSSLRVYIILAPCMNVISIYYR